jgi:hypothetical protein
MRTQIFYHNPPNNLRNQRSKLPLYGQIFDNQAINYFSKIKSCKLKF